MKMNDRFQNLSREEIIERLDKALDFNNHQTREMTLVDELAEKNEKIKKLEEKVSYLENQLRIRGNTLKATESKVEELYGRLEEKDKVIDAVSTAWFELERTRVELTDQLKLAMRAGAYAIRNNKKYQSGWFKSGDDEIQWLEAEKLLLCTAEGLNPDECEIRHE
jgi:chromosome segregation ATPase